MPLWRILVSLDLPLSGIHPETIQRCRRKSEILRIKANNRQEQKAYPSKVVLSFRVLALE